ARSSCNARWEARCRWVGSERRTRSRASSRSWFRSARATSPARPSTWPAEWAATCNRLLAADPGRYPAAAHGREGTIVPDASNRRTLPAAILGIAGGVLALIAYPIHWGTVSGVRIPTIAIKGGVLALILGAVIVVAALAMPFLATRQA